MNNEKKQLQDEISEMEELLNDSSTPADIKPAIKEGIDKAKGLLKELEAAQQVPAPKPAEVKKQEKKIIDEKTAMQKAAEITKGHKPAAKPVVTKQVKADAVKKAKAVVEKISEKKVVTAKKKISTAMPSLKKLVSRAKELAGYKGMSESDLQRDAGRKAKRPGKRVSASGDVYYENRANRTDVNRKKFPFLEKGGSVDEDLYVAGITDAQKAKLKVIFEKFAAKDYWGYKYQLASRIEYWKKLVAAKDESAMKYTEQDIRDSFSAQERIAFATIVNSLYKFITEKNVQKLKDRVRYDQKVSLEVYEVLTGESLKGKSNKELIEYFKKKYEAGSFEKGGQLKYKNGKDVPFSIYGSGGEYFIKDNNSNNTLPSSTVSYWTGSMNKFSSKKQANDALIKMLKKMHEEQPGYNPKFEAGGKVEDIKKGSLVFNKYVGKNGLVGLVVSDKYYDKELECDHFDVYYRGLMGEVHPTADFELVDVRQSSLHNAIQNGDIDAYYSIAGKKGFEINPIYKEMADEDEMTDEWDGERRNGEDNFKKGGDLFNKGPKVSYAKHWGPDGTVYTQKVKIDKATFNKLKDNVASEIALKNPRKDEYVYTSGHEFYLEPLRLDKNRCYLNHTQTRFINLFLKLPLKDRNTSLVIIDKYEAGGFLPADMIGAGAGNFEKGGRIDDPEKDGPYTLHIFKSKLSMAAKVPKRSGDIKTFEEAKKEAVESIEAGNYLVYIYSKSGYLWAVTEDGIESFEKGGQVDNTFNYMMLSRLQSDCEYFLNYGGRSERHLREGNVDAHIKEMKRLWNMLEVKPEWLSMEQIEDYEKKMKNEFEKGGVIEDDPFVTKYQKYNNTQKGEFKSGDKVTVRWMGDNVVGEIIEHIPETVAQNGGFRHTYFIKLPGVTEPQRFFQNAILGSENEFEKGGVVKYEGSKIIPNIPKYILENAKKTALRDGYDQYISYDKEGNSFSFGRSYTNRLLTNGEILVGKVVTYFEKGGISKVKVELIKSYESGGVVKYEGKTPRQIWDLWDLNQRLHFLNDHVSAIQKHIEQYSKMNYEELPHIVKVELITHTKSTQYEDGGFLPADMISAGAGNFAKGGKVSQKNKTIDWDTFDEKYKPIQNTVSNREEFNGWLFETYGEDEAYVIDYAKKHPNNVWTIIDDDPMPIISGLHYVNRFGYIITENPWKESITVLDDDDFEKGGSVEKNKHLNELLRNFVNSAVALNNEWQSVNYSGEELVDGYPFKEDFGELIHDIIAWGQANNVEIIYEQGGQVPEQIYSDVFEQGGVVDESRIDAHVFNPGTNANPGSGYLAQIRYKGFVFVEEKFDTPEQAQDFLDNYDKSKLVTIENDREASRRFKNLLPAERFESGGEIPKDKEEFYQKAKEYAQKYYLLGPEEFNMSDTDHKNSDEAFEAGETYQEFIDYYAEKYDLVKVGKYYKNGGRLLSARNRDRAYQSNEPHEQRYKRTTRPKHPKYSYAKGGGVEDTNESFYGETPKGGTYGINCKESDQVFLAMAVGSKSIDNYIPLPGVPTSEQVKRIKETGNLTDSENPTYWESEDGSHGWCDKHTGQVFQWG